MINVWGCAEIFPCFFFFLYRCIPFIGEVVCVWDNVDKETLFIYGLQFKAASLWGCVEEMLIFGERGKPGALTIYTTHPDEILRANIQCCSLSKRKMNKSQNVLVSVGKIKK